ncbi:reflectin, reflectin 14 [Acanthosepion pharaonis]|uniref:Reflectin, reflectin 14 n=1 Tax=Acanthosepion pharaonis TaxID=158019 RepID=A0A812C3T1_ACAPH|nr:reflectin, reflectin 14 [Sepia pharaonis]
MNRFMNRWRPMFNNMRNNYYGRSMFNYDWMMDGDRYNRYYRWMDFPEWYMDMSGYQMDMYGRWMDMQGRHCNPFRHWWHQRHGHYPGFHYGGNMFYPERWMDMSNYSMDMQGRYMNRWGRHCNPFSHFYNHWNSYWNHPGYYNYHYNWHMYYPESYFDMSNWQMDMQGRWMDRQGRYSNPYWYNWQGRHMYYPYQNYYWYGRWNYPGMDYSNWQMDFQGRWMDNHGRYMDPWWNEHHFNHYY